MKILGPISEDQMIAEFLRGELSSERFGESLKKHLGGAEATIISHPKTDSPEENLLRRSILATYRGYGENRELFEGFPDDVEWFSAEMTREELLTVRYIDYSYWNELSNNTHLPTEAANTIRAGKEVFGVSNEKFIKAAKALEQGIVFPPVILAGKDENSPIFVLEGHLRLTAYALNPSHIPETNKVIVGFSEKLTTL